MNPDFSKSKIVGRIEKTKPQPKHESISLNSENIQDYIKTDDDSNVTVSKDGQTVKITSKPDGDSAQAEVHDPEVVSDPNAGYVEDIPQIDTAMDMPIGFTTGKLDKFFRIDPIADESYVEKYGADKLMTLKELEENGLFIEPVIFNYVGELEGNDEFKVNVLHRFTVSCCGVAMLMLHTSLKNIIDDYDLKPSTAKYLEGYLNEGYIKCRLYLDKGHWKPMSIPTWPLPECAAYLMQPFVSSSSPYITWEYDREKLFSYGDLIVKKLLAYTATSVSSLNMADIYVGRVIESTFRKHIP